MQLCFYGLLLVSLILKITGLNGDELDYNEGAGLQYPVLGEGYRLTVIPRIAMLQYSEFKNNDIGQATPVCHIWINLSVQPPTSPSYRIEFGDGEQTGEAPLNCSDELASVNDGPWQLCTQVQHTYHDASSFTLVLVVNNLVSSKNYAATFAIYSHIKNLHINVEYTENEDKPMWIPGYPGLNPSKAYTEMFFPSEKPIRFTAVTGFGSNNFQFCFYTSVDAAITNCSGTWAPSTNFVVRKFDYDTPCFARLENCGLSVSVVASNPIDTATASITIMLQKPTVNLKIVEFGPAAKGDQFPIYATFDQFGTDSCLEVNYGTEKLIGEATTQKVLLGSEYMCAESHTQSELLTFREISPTEIENKAIRLPVKYSEGGQYLAAVTARNFVDAVETAKLITVTNDGCYPRAFIEPLPGQVFKQHDLNISAQVLVQCLFPANVDVTWAILFRNDTSLPWKDLALNSNNTMSYHIGASKDVSLFFPGRTLQYGFYKFLLDAKMKAENGTTLTSSRFAEVEVIKSDLAVCVSPQETFRNVVFKDTVTMNAYQYAFDPDIGGPDGPKDGIQVHYYCKRECDGPWPNLSNLADVKSFLGRTQGPFMWGTCSSGDDKMLKLQGYDKNGCFINGYHLRRSSDPDFSWGFPSLDPTSFTRQIPRMLCGENATEDCEIQLSTVDPQSLTLSIASIYQFENETYNLMAIITKDTRYTIVQQSYRLERNPPESQTQPTRSVGDCLAAYIGPKKDGASDSRNQTVFMNGLKKNCGSFLTNFPILAIMYFFLNVFMLLI